MICLTPTRLPTLATFAIAASLVLSAGQSAADARDGVCFPLFRAAGAVPLTNSCVLDANTANVGLSTFDCTGLPDYADRYCGNVLVPGTCKAQPKFGNPVDSSNGNKSQVERDYVAEGLFPLMVERYYNSSALADQGSQLDHLWRTNYDRTIQQTSAPGTALAIRQDGKIFYFSKATGTWATSADIDATLEQLKDASGQTTGWVLHNRYDDSVETYDASGNLNLLTSRNGQRQTLTRSTADTPFAIAPVPGLLITVTDHFGRQLNFTWDDSSRLATATTPEGKVFTYAYNTESRLASVSFPSSGAVQQRTYLYNEPAFTAGADLPFALTGVVDENNARLATYSYNTNGLAVGTQHALNADKYQLDYQSLKTVVTDPLGSVRTYGFQKILGAQRLTSISQPGGAGCAAASNAIGYDAHGNPSSETDFKGVTTTFTYDLTRNLETSRTVAFGTPLARTTTTEWHPTYRLPKRIAEPLLITTMTHDASGNVLTRTLQATTDANGSKAFTASATGSARTWTYTWNTVGQMLTATGPRTDVVDRTTYTYETGTGNLQTIINAVGQVTKLSAYDANGRVGSLLDPNGAVTTLTYYPRGWLWTSSTQAANSTATQTTTYTYDGVGQLKTVTFPAGEVVTYSYDDAHRLYEIKDSQSNKITYGLDNMGNHIGETVTDPNGTLARSVTRVIDALNRVKTVTGAPL